MKLWPMKLLEGSVQKLFFGFLCCDPSFVMYLSGPDHRIAKAPWRNVLACPSLARIERSAWTNLTLRVCLLFPVCNFV